MIFPVKPEVIGYVPMIFHENVHLSKILPCFSMKTEDVPLPLLITGGYL
jgi:hypothetical protein